MADYFLPRKKWHDKEWAKKKNWYSYNWSWENFSTPSRILLENYGHVHFQAFHSITLGEQRDLTLYFPRTKKKTVIPWLRTSAFHASQHIKTRRKSFIGLALTRRKEVEIYEKRKERPCLSKVDRIFFIPTPFLYAFPKITTR